MCHVWNWLSSKWSNTRSREPEVSLKSHLVPRGRQLEHMPIFRVGWIQFIHIHPKNIMQHIAEEVGEEQAEATFISLHWGTVKKLGTERWWWKWWCHLHLLLSRWAWWVLVLHCCHLPFPQRVSITAATTGDPVTPSGGHTERVRWMAFVLCL